MSQEQIAAKNLALMLAFQNASEMIRSHGEEGFCYDNELLNKEYRKAVNVAAKRINRLSNKYEKLYNKIGIEIDSSCDDSL